MSKSLPQPRSRKTPTGGMKNAKMILMISLRYKRCQSKSVMIAASPEMLAGTPKTGSLTYDPVKGIVKFAEPKDLALSRYFERVGYIMYIQSDGSSRVRFDGERSVVLEGSELTN
jgi:hypothetical protein